MYKSELYECKLPFYSCVFGYISPVSDTLTGGGYIALIKGAFNILVGTGLPIDKALILEGILYTLFKSRI